ncbi:MAG: NAD(+) diphosphatase [Desulfuromonas sp.]|nr:NAD(+) diphosphatase [Desulfuromonas sp.]
MFPQHYDSPIDLPFNRRSLEERLLFRAPHEDPGGDGCWLIMRGGRLLVDSNGLLPTTLTVSEGPGPLYVGLWDGQPCRAVTLSRSQPLPDGLQEHDLLAADPRLTLDLLSLGALGQQLLRWQKNSLFCSVCGGQMHWCGEGWGRQCDSCRRQHYPHIHPCVIVLIRRGDELLLVRKESWVPGRYGLVAGFVDPGECLEEAVVREVMEETGIQVNNIRYVGSQSWPFPSQIMAGFVADYVGGEVVIEEDELEDARWFNVNQLPQLPLRRSIARYLIDRYGIDQRGKVE